MCEQCRQREQADKVVWIAVRRALLMVVKAVEVRYGLGKQEQQDRAA